MFQKKMPKCQMPDKNEFTAHYFHSVEPNNRNWPDVINIISIDPGIRNLAIRVESRPVRKDIISPIKTLVFDKLRISENDRKMEENIDKLYFLVSQFLDQYLSVFKTCHMLIIERQLPMNLKATRIAQHIISYFMLHLKDIIPSLPMIFEIDAKLKGRELGASTHLNERGIKQWSIDHCKLLLEQRKDYEGIEILKKHKKKDDLSDCVCQIEALFSFQGWPLTIEYVEKKKLTLKIINK